MGRIYEMRRNWFPLVVVALAGVVGAAPAGAQGVRADTSRGDTTRAPRADARKPVTVELATIRDSAPPPPVSPLGWDLDVESNASRTRVTYFVDVFAGRAKPVFEMALTRQTRFADLIAAKLRAGGLPQDLTYLALIESFYDPHAYSVAAAVGMWQFMTGTARGVGLRVDWWIDERRDPVRSTEGAVRLLSSLHDDFGSFFLAAAAYNGGSGRVSRGLAQYAERIGATEGEDRFFALSDTRYLRPQTRDYVPKMIAAALVAKQAQRYDLHVDTLAPFAFDSVFVAGGTSLAAVAAAAPTDVAEVMDLNPSVLRGMLPAGDSLWVRVPVGAAAGFASRMAVVDTALVRGLQVVTSKKGESMSSIARRYKLTAKQLNWYNPNATRLKSGNLVPGQPINVPSAAVVAAARDVPNPAIERYPRRRATPSKTVAKAPTVAAKPAPAKKKG